MNRRGQPDRTDFLTSRQTAELLGVALSTVQQWTENGLLRAWKTAGGHRRISRQSVEALVRQQRLAVDTAPAHGQPPKAIVPLSISLQLSARDIRELDPVMSLVKMLAAQPGIERHSGVVYTILSELYLNAVDHGLLKLDSCSKTDAAQFSAYYDERERALGALQDGSVSIAIRIDRGPAAASLTLRVSDSGDGYAPAAPAGIDDRLHGRGMAIVAGLCQRVTVCDDGKTVEAVYAIDEGPAVAG